MTHRPDTQKVERFRYSQKSVLEEEFWKDKYPSSYDISSIAARIGATKDRVKVKKTLRKKFNNIVN